MRRLAITLAALLALALPASASAWYGDVFMSPTGNLVCKYRPALFRITCGSRADHRIVTMTAFGTAHEGRLLTWSGETSHVLYYGQTWRSDRLYSISCLSTITGVTCRNQDHGFTIARGILSSW